MARVVKVAGVRRNEILAAAYKLFVRDGYEGTTVNALLDDLGGLSKGAFYHHFESKEEVMQALARRMAEEMYARAAPLVERRDLSPLERMNLIFGTGAQYKREHLPMIRAMVEIYCREENLRLRNRMIAESIAVMSPLLTRVLEQGKDEGVFTIDDAAETARLIIHMGTFLHDAFGEAWKAAAVDRRDAVARYRRRVDAYARAVERILGLPPSTLALIDDETLDLFLQREETP